MPQPPFTIVSFGGAFTVRDGNGVSLRSFADEASAKFYVSLLEHQVQTANWNYPFPKPPQPQPNFPPPPPPPPNPWPSNMGGGGQPPTPPPPPPNPWPSNMGAPAPPPPPPPNGWPTNMGGGRPPEPPPPNMATYMGAFGGTGQPFLTQPHEPKATPRHSFNMPVDSEHGPGLGDHLRNFGRRFGQDFGQALPQAAIYGGGVRSAARAAFAAAAPEVAIPVAMLKGMKDAATAGVNALEGLAKSAVDANHAIAKFSPALSVAFARLQLNEFRRGMGMARETELTGTEVIKAFDRMNNSLYPYRNFAQNVGNEVGGFGAGFVGASADGFAPIVQVLEAIRKGLDPSGDAAAGWGEMLGNAMVWGFRHTPGFNAIFEAADELKKFFGIQDKKPGQDLGAWDQLILGQQPGNPFRATPLMGGRQFNPARRG